LAELTSKVEYCVLTVLFALALLVGTPGHVAAQSWSQRCSAIARAHLIDSGIVPLDIQDVSVIERPEIGNVSRKQRPNLTQREAVNEGLIAGYTVRIRLQSCDGIILFGMGKRCQIQSVDSRGDCQVPPSADPWEEDG